MFVSYFPQYDERFPYPSLHYYLKDIRLIRTLSPSDDVASVVKEVWKQRLIALTLRVSILPTSLLSLSTSSTSRLSAEYNGTG